MNLFVFPGQGSQYPGMAKDFYENFKYVQELFEEASDASQLNLKKIIFDSSESELAQTDKTQISILVVSISIWTVLMRENEDFLGESQDRVFAGHSLGEYSALVAMGALSLYEAAKCVRARGLAMAKASGGGMSALLFKKNPEKNYFLELEVFLSKFFKESSEQLFCANYNSPEQIIISGSEKALELFPNFLKEYNLEGYKKFIKLKVSAPFHSELMLPAQEKMQEVIQSLEIHKVDSKYIANIDAQFVGSDDAALIRSNLIKQITQSVLWYPSMIEARKAKIQRVLEVGPSQVLKNMIKRYQWEEWSDVKNIGNLEEFKNACS